MNWAKFFRERFKIVNKQGVVVPLVANPIQELWLAEPSLMKIELKARQEGLSAIILAKKTAKLIIEPNRYIVTLADVSENAVGLLERVKFYLTSYEETTGVKIPLKYNSKYELHNEATNSKFIIGTAENLDVGRSKTITDLHMSEAAFYRSLKRLLASALQAVVPDGEVDIETTANGFNEFREFWAAAVRGENGFTPLFYGASRFYSPEFLEDKRRQLGRLFKQEYPETAEEAFLTSGDSFFDTESLSIYLTNAKTPIGEGVVYA